ncbi:helix-turn-helix domain-containing protein [Sphingobacterium faecium]|uniref:helix-turn-helix domain-containing protein n=1 Tax=Sphingobacterium faecium TaxID=34087 RepID=UPI003D3690DC
MKNIRNEKLIKALGQRVRLLRNEKKMTMLKLAELSGIDYRQLSYIELGQTDPGLSTLYAIAQGLDITLSFLMDSESLR